MNVVKFSDWVKASSHFITLRITLFVLVSLFLNDKAFSQKKAEIKSLTVVSGKDDIKSISKNVPVNTTDSVRRYTKSQEDYKQKKVKIDEYFKYIFPIITLLLGIALNKGLDWFNERRRIKKTGKRWVAEIMFLQEPIQQQIASLEFFEQNHAIESFTIPTMDIASQLDMEIFKSLDKSDLLEYLNIFKSKEFNEAVSKSNIIHGFVNILSSHNSQLKEKYSEYSEQVSENTTKFSLALQALGQNILEYQIDLEREIGGDPTNDPRFLPILNLYNEHIFPHMSTGEYDIFILRDQFFAPLIAFLDSVRQDSRTGPIRRSIAECTSAIGAIRMERVYFSENVATFIQKYKDSIESLHQILNGIDQHKH